MARMSDAPTLTVFFSVFFERRDSRRRFDRSGGTFRAQRLARGVDERCAVYIDVRVGLRLVSSRYTYTYSNKEDARASDAAFDRALIRSFERANDATATATTRER